MLVRLQKFLAEGGIASRRASEGLIREGRVLVNGQTVRELGSKVDPGRDEVMIDGAVVRPRRKMYVALNKPRGFICSRRAEGQQKTVLSLLPKEWASLYPVGRLDKDTEGLLFLTNDGEFCLRVTHPRYQTRKRYVAAVAGRVTLAVIHRLKQGVVEHGERLRAEQARILSANATRSVVELELIEGRYHEVRRLFAAQGLQVDRLQRIQIGPIKLGELRPGRHRQLTPAEIRALTTPPATGPRRRQPSDGDVDSPMPSPSTV